MRIHLPPLSSRSLFPVTGVLRWFLPGIVFLWGSAAAQPPQQTVVFWHHYADEERAAFWETLVEEFNRTNPDGITVEVQYYPSYNHQNDAILSGLLNGQIPHVALVRNHHAALYQMSGALVDLTPYIDFDTEKFYPLIWQQDVINGQRLGLPLTRAFEAVYVNRDLLRELGYESLPTTRDEMGEMACQFAEKRGFTRVGFEIPLSASFFIALNAPSEIYDGQVFDFDLSETVLFLQNLLTKRCVSLNIGTFAEAQNRFAAGQTLFYIDSTAARPYVEGAVSSFFADPFELAVMPVPAADGPTANVYGPSLVLFHHGEVQNRAGWQFINWLAEPEQMQRWAEKNDALPARQDVESEFGVEFLQAEWMSEPGMAGYDLIRDEVVFALREILSGGAEIQTRLRELNQTANEIQQVFDNKP
ncbi:MAG: extracellular solute-binding protein [Anaerolineae bacterium]|nr:extracellular solute-binding protein [Anaerolineae bacterium]